MKAIVLTALFLLTPVVTRAEEWYILCPKAILTGDIQSFNVGTGNSTNTQLRYSHNEAANPSLPIQFFINGQPSRPDQLDPYGAVLTGTFYNKYSRSMERKFFFEAPARMPDKNPVEIKAIVTPASGAPITVTFTIIVLAEHWTFTHFHGLHYRCYDGGNSNPKNMPVADMGMATQVNQAFHFTAKTLNFLTGETTAVLDGDPTIVYSKQYQGGSCNPAVCTAKLLWGNDDQTLIKNVNVRFTGERMTIDYQIDYMNWLGWTIVETANGYVINHRDRKPGKHDAPAHVDSPLQRSFISQFTNPADQQIMLHSAGGVQLKAND